MLTAFRQEVVDIAEPQLWGDDELLRYLNAAVFEFVRRTGGIADVSSPATQVPVLTGISDTPLHPAILRIMRARRRSDGRLLRIVNLTDVGASTEDDYGQMVGLYRVPRPGPVTHMMIGEERNKASWLCLPDEDDIVDLSIYRLPLQAIRGLDQELTDVEEMHHLHLFDHMKYLAYRKQDIETLNPQESQRGYEGFERYCQQVTAEWERYKHKNRVVRYGGL